MKNFSLIFLAALCALLTSCKTSEKITCPNGEIVFRYKKPQDHYKSFVKTTDLNLESTISVLEKIKLTDLKASAKKQVTLLKERLDQFSGRFQDILKANFEQLNNFPCDINLRAKSQSLIENLSKENIALERLKTDMQGILSSKNAAGISETEVKNIIQSYEENSKESAIK